MGIENLTDEQLRSVLDKPMTRSERVKNEITSTANALKKEPVDFEFSKMVENIPQSGMNYADDMATAVMNPIDTLSGLGKAAVGGVQKMIPGEAGPDAMIPNYEPVADAIGQHFAGRYGSPDQFKTTLMEDSVGVLGDTAGALAGVGMLPKLGKVGQLGSLLDPTNMALRGGSKAVQNMPYMRTRPEKWYQEAAKIPGDNADSIVRTALDNQLMPTGAGLAKADSMISGYNDSLTNLINQSASASEYVPAATVFKALDDAKSELGGFRFDAPQDLANVNSKIEGFKSYLDTLGTDFVTLKELQEFKTDLYKGLKFNRKNQTATKSDEVLRKNMARAAKEGIEEYIPEAKGLNIKMGDLIEFTEGTANRASVIDRRNPISLDTLMGATAGGVTSGGTGAATGAAVGILQMPRVRARLALGMEKIKTQKISDAKKRVLAIELIRNEVSSQYSNQPLSEEATAQ